MTIYKFESKEWELKNYSCLLKLWTSACSNNCQHNYCSTDVCWASSPSIWTEVQWLGALQYSWTSYNTSRKQVQTNTGSSIYLNCFFSAGLKHPCCKHLKQSQQNHDRRNHMYLLCQRRPVLQMSCIFDIIAHPYSHPSLPLEKNTAKKIYFICMISVKNGESLKYRSRFCNPTTTNIIIWCKGQIWIIYIIILSLVVLIVYKWTQHTGWQNISNWLCLPRYKGKDY